MPQKVVLLDANSLLYRAFFALPPLTTAKGEMTNGVYGFAVMLYKILEEEKPDYIAAAFDLPAPTFRHEHFADYKATREKTPDGLIPQLAMAHELLECLRIPIFEQPGFEADDLLGTLACSASAQDRDALVVSGDLDVLQLVDDHVSVLITKRGVSDTVRYDPAAIHERYSLLAEQLVDYKSMRGDTSDNIPGVPGIGDKTAIALLQQFGSLEAILENLDQVKPARVANALHVYANQARMSKLLAKIACDIPLAVDWGQLRLHEPDLTRLRDLFQRLEFRGLMKKLTPAADVQPAIALRPPQVIETLDEACTSATALTGIAGLTLVVVAEPGSPHTARPLAVLMVPEQVSHTDTVSDAVPSASTQFQPLYLNADPKLLAPFASLLEDERIPKIGHSLKDASILLSRLGITVQGVSFDTEIASYLANPLRKSHDLWEVAFDMLGASIPEPLDLAAAAQVGQSGLFASPLVDYAALRAQYIRELHPLLAQSMNEQELTRLFTEVEMPLVPVLAEMELEGVSIDVPYLDEFAERLQARITEAEEQIYILAGEEFVINSPKQLQHILFEKLQLRRGKRTKTGFSTDAATLAKLAEDFEIVARILEYRELTKLKSTYVDALPRLVNPRTGRIHPSFNQVVTATGRLSCSDPNLQNIPIRSDLGKEIRRAFVTRRPEDKLVAADYSQIELRVLADISGDEALHKVFEDDLDLHTATACEVFGVAAELVTSDMRRLAKIINFAIPYGTSPQGLAKSMGISVEEARRYMDLYFERFVGVAGYIELIKAKALESGGVTTIMGRRRQLPEIGSPNMIQRELAERMAINTPIQGSAADIMKLAMLKVAAALRTHGCRSRMILQVHDELVFECPHDEIDIVAEIAREGMENAYRLSVPLKVDLEVGNNWRDMEKP